MAVLNPDRALEQQASFPGDHFGTGECSQSPIALTGGGERPIALLECAGGFLLGQPACAVSSAPLMTRFLACADAAGDDDADIETSIGLALPPYLAAGWSRFTGSVPQRCLDGRTQYTVVRVWL